MVGADPESLVSEVERAPASWVLASAAPALRRQSLLVVGASEGNAATTRALADSVRAGSRPAAAVTSLTFQTDHGFADHRVALTGAVVTWLAALSGKTAP